MERLPDRPVGFFLHVPWPSPDIFARLPWLPQGQLAAMARHVRGHDVHRWMTGQLAEIASRGGVDAPA